MTDLRHLSREEQKLLADVALLVQNDDQVLKAAAPDEASGEFWFRMAETLSTLPPNRSLDLRLNGGRLTVAVSILSVLLQDSPEIPQLWAQKVIALNYWHTGIRPARAVWRSRRTRRRKPMRKSIWRRLYRKTCFPL